MLKINYFYVRLYIILINLFCSIACPMEHAAVHTNHFSTLPDELLRVVLAQKVHQYPWENFINARQLGRTCKQWYNAVADNDTLAQACNIPPMHCAAMMNDATKIIELKLAGHSPLAPDAQRCTPFQYAVV